MDNIEEIIKNKEFKNTEVIDNLLQKNYSIQDISKALATCLSVLQNGNTENMSKYDFTQDENGNVRLFFSVGKKDKIMVKDIVGCIKAHTALTTETIGRVNLLDSFSFVEVPAGYVEEVIKNVNGQEIKGKVVNIEIAKS